MLKRDAAEAAESMEETRRTHNRNAKVHMKLLKVCLQKGDVVKGGGAPSVRVACEPWPCGCGCASSSSCPPRLQLHYS